MMRQRCVKGESEVNKQIRQIVYRSLSRLEHGVLGPGLREPIPSCCIWRVRREFPGPDYTGFKKTPVGNADNQQNN